MEVTLIISGMHCKSCDMLIEDALMDIRGVNRVNTDHKTGRVVIDHNDVDINKIRQVINKEGYGVL